jgi:hypothetical protein
MSVDIREVGPGKATVNSRPWRPWPWVQVLEKLGFYIAPPKPCKAIIISLTLDLPDDAR